MTLIYINIYYIKETIIKTKLGSKTRCNIKIKKLQYLHSLRKNETCTPKSDVITRLRIQAINV